MEKTLTENEKSRRRRYRLVFELEAFLEAPMFFLSVLWLFFFILELVHGLTQT